MIAMQNLVFRGNLLNSLHRVMIFCSILMINNLCGLSAPLPDHEAALTDIRGRNDFQLEYQFIAS